MRKAIVLICFAIVFGLLTAFASADQETTGPDAKDTIGRTPPRLSLTGGQVSYWRPGAADWTRAQVNTALAPGDQLFSGPDSRMEIQIGGQAFVRGGADTQVGLESQEPDYIQFKVTSGEAFLDLRRLAPGRMVEVDTPNAAFTIDTQGYYRLNVDDVGTEFISRRAGRATATTADGDRIVIATNTVLTVVGSDNPSISYEAAPPLDALDQWNYARTDRMLEDRVSGRYVSSEIYGIADLDRYGTWRTVPTYGVVWIPADVDADWVPYSTGAWMHDPYYGWTWVDTSPWGWAPYHYGRWVYFDRRWCWAPGPRIARPAYAPALVAFFGEPGGRVGIAIGGPVVGWVPLGWGEPLVPWWGRPGFIHRPWWGGWGGPHIVNGRIVHRRTIIKVAGITHYHNVRVRNAVVVVARARFGRGPVTHAHLIHGDSRQLRPVHAAPGIAVTPVSLVPNPRRGLRPPERHLKRTVVHTGRFPGKRPVGGHGRGAVTVISPRGPHPPAPQPFRTGRGNGRHGKPHESIRPPAVHRDGHASEPHRGLLPSFRRPPTPRPQTPAHMDRPAAPRVAAPPAAPMKPDAFHRPKQTAPRPPRAVHDGRPTRPEHSSSSRRRIESHGRGMPGQGVTIPPPAVHSRSQGAQRSFAPRREHPKPRQNENHRSSGAVRNARPRQERGAPSLDRGPDSPGPSQRYNPSAPNDSRGGNGRYDRTNRPGRAF